MQIRRLAPLLTLSTLLLATGSASAQDMIGTSWDGEIYLVDSGSGSGSLLTTVGVKTMNSMARRSDGTLFIAGSGTAGGAGPSTVYELDPLTGLGTPVATVPIGAIRGIAFGPGDVLYAVNSGTYPQVGPSDLHVLDLASGTAPYIGSTGFNGVTSLAYGKGQLWGWECGSGAGTGVGLITIDIHTGVATDVNPAINGTCSRVQSLTFSPGGVLYGGASSLHIIDMATGGWNTVGFLPWELRGLEFLEPAGPSLYCTARPTSCGTTPTISAPAAMTSQSLAAPGSFDIGVGLVPTGANPGVLIYSWGGALAAPISGPYGFLCIKPGTGFFRILNPVTPGAGTGCDSTYVFDFGAYLANQLQDPGLKSPFLPRLVEIQAWYRDPPNPNGANLTNAMTISVLP